MPLLVLCLLIAENKEIQGIWQYTDWPAFCRVGYEVTPDIVSFNTMIKACGSTGDLDSALQLYGLITARRLEPTIATYSTLMAAAAKVGSASRALEVWSYIGQQGLRPNTTCMNVIIAALEQCVRTRQTRNIHIDQGSTSIETCVVHYVPAV